MSLRRRELLGVSLAALAATAWTHGSSNLIANATINGVVHAPATLATLVAATPSAGTLALPAGTFSGAGTTASMAVQMTITGAGPGLTVLDCSSIAPAQGKGLLVTQTAGSVISGLTTKGAAIPGSDGNACGVRDSGTGDSFTLTNVEITGCQDGILSSSSVTLTGCNIHGNGNGNPGNGFTHEIYISVGSTTATLTNTSATCSLLSCHALKSRAPTTTISGGTFTGNSDNGAVGSSVLEFPDGGSVSISGTTLITSGVTNNSFLNYGAESATNSGTGTTVTLTNVHITDNTGTGGVFQNFTFIPSATLAIGSGCVYDGIRPPTFSGWGTITGSFSPASPGFSVALGAFNAGGSTLSTPSEFSTTFPIAVGDLPSGHKFVCNGPSGNVVIQEDRAFPPWVQDGSGKGRVISMILPDSFTAGQTRNYTLTQTVGTPNNIPFITLAQLASGATINSIVFPATDFKMKFYNGDLGLTDVFHVGVNDIITNGTNWPWGSNPFHGWEVIRAGPVCCEWKFWGYLKRDSDSSFHRWVRATIWVRAWVTGKYEVAALVMQPNCYGPITGATVGSPGTPVRVSCFAELYNGGTLIKAFGGPNDTRTYTFAASAVNVGANTFSLTSPQAQTWGRNSYGTTSANCYYGLGAVFSTSGSLPGGISANTVYWPAQASGATVGTAFNVAGTRYDAMTSNNGGAVPNTITITSQGSGTHTITPVMSTFQSNGWYALDSTALPFWIGSGSKPALLPVHDRTYLTRKAKVLPYFDWTTTAYPINETPQTHMPGIAVYQSNFETGGDSAGDERINPAGGHSALMTMYVQTDPGWYQNARALAAGFIDAQQLFIDEKSGQPVVCNLGPNRAGANYTNLGPTNSNYRGFYGGGSPPAVTLSGSTADWTGYDISFDAADFSHQPSPTMMPYLRSGDDWWLEGLKQQVGGMLAMGYQPNRNQTIGPTSYGGIVVDPIPQQVRTCAWSMRTLGFYDYVMPQSEAIRAFIKDCVDDNAAILPPWGAAKSANEIAIGAFGIYGGGGQPSYQNEAGYMLAMIGVIFGWQALIGERSGWMTFYNNYLKHSCVDTFNPANGSQCSDYWLGTYWWNMYVSTSGTGAFYSSPAAFLAGNLGAAAPGGSGFPTVQILNVQFQGVVGGIAGVTGGNADWTCYVAMHRAALASWVAAGGANAATVLGNLNTRLAALGGLLYTNPNTQLCYPDWNILSS